jgi:hypothetical protein
MAAVSRVPAIEQVERVLRGVLPDNVPPSWRSINGARYVSSGRHAEATADVTMFDGKPAKVRVWVFGQGGHAHEWLDLPGGHCSFEGGRWIRINPATLEPFPDQASLPFAAAPSPSAGS